METEKLPRIARGLGLVWACCWMFFGFASGIGEGLDPVGILIHTTVPGLIFLFSVAIAWRWEAIGGGILFLEGLLIFIGYSVLAFSRFPLSTIVFVLLTMGLPPLVAGILFLVIWWGLRK